MTAQYLLRFDDLCPTMNHERWRGFVPLLKRFGIRPILAVIPENHDPELEICPPEPNFWEGMREMQSAGAAIGLHGYRHSCTATGRSLIPLHARSEFAGAPPEAQRAWIRNGLEILRQHRLDAALWVAPRHGFDAATLSALRGQGINLISDGLASRPFAHMGMVWIPQQLWSPVPKHSGLWTICIHSNSATNASIAELEQFLQRFAPHFTSIEKVMQEWPIAKRSLTDRLFHWNMVIQKRLRA